MTSLTAKELAFIEMMRQSPSAAADGYRLLAEKPEKAKRLFQPLLDAGFLASEELPEPVAVENGYQLPYWAGLDYLLSLSNSHLDDDLEFARSLRDLVRELGTLDEHSEADPSLYTIFDNYHTVRKFAELLGKLPIDVIEEEDVQNSLGWLHGKFDRSLVATELANGVVENLINAGSKYKAFVLTYINRFTEIRCVDDDLIFHRDRCQTIVDGYWLVKILKKIVPPASQMIGLELSHLLIDRATEFLSKDSPDVPTFMPRPAIEPHSQNHSWRNTGNALVDGARNSLLLVIDECSDEEARKILCNLLQSEGELHRRLAIHVFAEAFEKVKGIPIGAVTSELFDRSTHHEFHRYLSMRFESHLEEWRDKLVTLIESMEKEDTNEDLALEHRKLRWLAAICPGVSDRANQLYDEIVNRYGIGVSGHPDFLIYMETGWVTDSSPYSADALLEAQESNRLTSLLNSFEPEKHPKSPTVRGLVATLESVVSEKPDLILEWRPKFLEQKPPYVYALIEGYRRYWKSEKKSPERDYEAIEFLLLEMRGYLNSDEFWAMHGEVGDGWTPDANWIPSAVAELISDGTRADESAFDKRLNVYCFEIIGLLLERLPQQRESESEDALSRAINSERGRVLQSLILLALRECRLADWDCGGHEEVWERYEKYFDNEVHLAKTFNQDISPLIGDYLANFYYLSKGWIRSALERIGDHLPALVAFFHGYSYATPVREGFVDLESLGLIDKVMKSGSLEGDFRERIWERVALASLHGDVCIIDKASQEWTNEDDLRSIVGLYSKVHDDQLENNQKKIVLQFWSWVLEHLDKFEGFSASQLAPLLKYVDDINLDSEPLIAPVFKETSDDSYDFEVIRFLTRQIDSSLEKTADLMTDLFSHWKPSWDMDSSILTMLRKLMENRDTRVKAFELCGKLEHLPDVRALYEEYSNLRNSY